MKAAFEAAGISRTAAYEWRADDETFRGEWDSALCEGIEAAEREAWRRGQQGVDKPVFGALGHGEGSGQIGVVREYSDTLLIFMLKAHRPEKYRERVEINTVVEAAAADLVEVLREAGESPDKIDGILKRLQERLSG